MIARVFYLSGDQQPLRRKIESLLRQHLYADLQVEALEIDEDSVGRVGHEVYLHAIEYLRLLKAAMIRDDDFNIQVIHKTGTWSYLGGYDSWASYNLRLPSSLMRSLFPAVAIMDRMVMVPHGMERKLQDPLQFPWFFRPLDLEGVALVDFSDDESLREAVREVSTRIEAEIACLAIRHMLARKLPNPDFVDLARLLAVDEEYLELHRSSFVQPPATRLEPKVSSGAALLDRPSRVTVEVRNESTVDFERLSIQIEAPTEVRQTPVRRYLDVAAGGRAAIEFELIPRAVPLCPLEVSFVPSETGLGIPPFPVTLWLDVVAEP